MLVSKDKYRQLQYMLQREVNINRNLMDQLNTANEVIEKMQMQIDILETQLEERENDWK